MQCRINLKFCVMSSNKPVNCSLLMLQTTHVCIEYWCLYILYLTLSVHETNKRMYNFYIRMISVTVAPRGAEAPPFPPFPLVLSLPRPLLFFLLFPYLIGFNYFLLLSMPSLSTRIVSLCFQAGGRRKRPNLGLVCCV